MKPGSAGPSMPGIHPVIYDEEGKEVPRGSGTAGNICIRNPWPGGFQTIWGDRDRYVLNYYEKYCKDKNSKDWRDWPYFTGDAATQSEDGYFRILGRIDDVINVAGHRLSTGAPEEVLCGKFHPKDFLTDVKTGMCYKKETLQTKELSKEDEARHPNLCHKAREAELWSWHENDAVGIRLLEGPIRAVSVDQIDGRNFGIADPLHVDGRGRRRMNRPHLGRRLSRG